MTNPLPALIAEGHLPNVEMVTDEPPRAAAHPDALAATAELIERLEANLTPPGPTDDEQWFGWIPLPLERFFAGMHVARQALGPGRHRFLDIGSGIGSKLALAHALGFDVVGLERWQPYVETSHRLFPHCGILPADVSHWTILVDGFDLVYCYGVATTPAEHDRINHLITDQMKPGALFFAPRPPFPDWLDHVGDRVWRKP